MIGKCRRAGVAAWVVGMTVALCGVGCLGPRERIDQQANLGGCSDPNCPRCQARRLQGGGMEGPGISGGQGSALQRVSYTQGGDEVISCGTTGIGSCPTEKMMSAQPPYTVAAPDILFIDTLRMVPRPPYRLEPMEVLLLNVAATATLPNQPINGPYAISPDGMINLGFNYGSVHVAGMTLDQAREAIGRELAKTIRDPAAPKDRLAPPQVNIALAQFRGMQQIRGEHLVRPDGTISLGTYGSVFVAGMRLDQVKCKVEEYLAQFLVGPQVSVDVFAYNSKKYYVIVDGAGFGQLVFSYPITGNETVLDAITNVNGLAPVSSKHRIWLARPAPAHLGCNQILPVDWNAISQGGSTRTNYQLFPGDRVYVAGDCLIATDNWLSKVLAPVERVLGVGFLFGSTRESLRGNNNNGNVVVVP